MRRFHAKVFDDFITAAQQAVEIIATSSQYDSILAKFDTIMIQAVVDSGDGNSTLRVFQQHSSDGKTWDYKNDGLLLFGVPITVGAITADMGMDLSGVPSLAFVRLTLQMDSGPTKARVRLYVTARDGGG